MALKDFPVQVGEKTYLLRYNYKAICLAEDLLGKSFFASLASMGMKEIATIFFVGLKHHEPGATMAEVERIIDEDVEDFAEFMKAVMEASGNYFQRSTQKKTVQTSASSSQTDG